MNEALQRKWLGRFLKEDGRLWRRIIEVGWGGLEMCDEARQISRGHGVGLWKKILMG